MTWTKKEIQGYEPRVDVPLQSLYSQEGLTKDNPAGRARFLAEFLSDLGHEQIATAMDLQIEKGPARALNYMEDIAISVLSVTTLFENYFEAGRQVGEAFVWTERTQVHDQHRVEATQSYMQGCITELVSAEKALVDNDFKPLGIDSFVEAARTGTAIAQERIKYVPGEVLQRPAKGLLKIVSGQAPGNVDQNLYK